MSKYSSRMRKNHGLSGYVSNIGFLLFSIQETKMIQLDLFMIRAVWGNLAFDFVCSNSKGLLRGILCIWDLALFIKTNFFLMIISYLLRVLGFNIILNY